MLYTESASVLVEWNPPPLYLICLLTSKTYQDFVGSPPLIIHTYINNYVLEVFLYITTVTICPFSITLLLFIH